jgi:copper chaperone CopZ
VNRFLSPLVLAAALTLAACARDARTTTDAVRTGIATDTAATATTAANDAAATPTDRRRSDEKAHAARTMDPSDPHVVMIPAPTIQCAKCSRTIRAAVRALDVTEDVKVDIKGKAVYVRVADNTPATREAIESAIAHAGYDTPMFKADPAAYDKLEECCKVGGMKGKEG